MAGITTIYRAGEWSDGPATVLAIGTANPPNVFEQESYPDYFFRVTNSEHKKELKEKFRRICGKSMVKKRYMHLTEEILKDHPNMCSFMSPSLDDRQDMLVEAVPRLGAAAAEKALLEWGRPRSEITHMVFCAMSGVDMPGADFQLLKLLGLSPAVNRLMIYQQGCFAGGTVLRLAKDLAENNKNARVLVVCSEVMALMFRGPKEGHIDNLIGQAIFGDGAAALVVGADPMAAGVEVPLFEIASAMQTVLPGSEGAVEGHLREGGLTFHLLHQVPAIIAENVEKSLSEAFAPLGIADWNELFYITHPGGPAVLDRVQEELGLSPEKLRATRHVLSEFGNMSSCTVLFIMDEMRRRSAELGCTTTGEGCEWGVLLGFGPGLTMEVVMLHSVPLNG